MTSDELSQYNHMRIYLDEDFTCPEKFTVFHFTFEIVTIKQYV